MIPLLSYRNAFVSGFVGALACLSPQAFGATYHYVDWQTANPAAGVASGVITLDDGTEVTVQFTAVAQDGSPGVLYGAQVSTGTNYWSPSTAYLSDEVENPPPPIDIVQLSGGLGHSYVLELSEPVKDPIMPILSLGQAELPTTYDFDMRFELVSQGAGYFGGTNTALEVLENDVLLGKEGHGTLRFLGTLSTISWTVPTEEAWHGFTLGIRTTERLEPTPATDAGVGAGTLDGAEDAGAGTDTAADPTADDSSALLSATSDAIEPNLTSADVTEPNLTSADVTEPNLTSADATEANASTADLATSVAVEPATVDAGSQLDAGASSPSTSDEALSIDIVQVTEAPDASFGTSSHADGSAPRPPDAGASNDDSPSGEPAGAECSCRTVGGTQSNSALFAVSPLALLGMAWGRRRRSKRG